MSEFTRRILKIITDPKLTDKSVLSVTTEFLIAVGTCNEMSCGDYMMLLETFEKVLNNEI